MRIKFGDSSEGQVNRQNAMATPTQLIMAEIVVASFTVFGC